MEALKVFAGKLALLPAAAVVMFLCTAVAHAQAFDGDADFKVFAGYLNVGGKSGVAIGADKGFNDWLSMGCALNIVEKGHGNSDAETLDRSDFMVTGNFHWQDALKLPMQFDIYTGLHAGIRTAGVQVGARYNFGETFGVYAEARQNIFDVVRGSNSHNYYYKKFCISAGLAVSF